MIKNSSINFQFSKHACYQFCMSQVLEKIEMDIKAWRKELENSKEKNIPKKKFVLFSTPRTGSTALCNALTANGFGDVREYFNEMVLQKYIASTNSKREFSDYLNLAYVHGSNSENIFGVNILVNQFLDLLSKKVNVLKVGYERIYVLERRNKLKQAFSLMKSQKTFIFTPDILAEAVRKFGTIMVEPDEVHFTMCLKKILREENYLKKTLKGKVDKVFYFEDIILDNFESTVLDIKENLELGRKKFVQLERNIMSTKGDKEVFNKILKKLDLEDKI